MKETIGTSSQVKALTEGLKNDNGIWKNPVEKKIDKKHHENIEKPKNPIRIVDLSKYLNKMDTVVGFFGIGEEAGKQSFVLFNNIKDNPKK